MISLILPYWERKDAAEKALRLLAETYREYDLEVVLVDDGNPQPFAPEIPGLNLKIVRLPQKDGPMCPASAWNAGARAASADVICLSCVEILHETAVLPEMERQVRELGPMGYVLASAWCPEYQAWHCHSTVKVPDCPTGTGIAFCGAMHRELFELVDGFDDAYRDGAGYEDRDLIRKLVAHGANFVIRDDLVVTHPKSGATINWDGEKFERNRALFKYKWMHKSVNFVCLKAGAEFGPDYVNILHDMVRRNLPLGYPGRFYCITDDAEGLDAGIEVLPLPIDLEKWWGKLYMFKRGLFPDGSRCMFFDLDTLIVGSIEPLAKYAGQFATLRDFYQPGRLGPAVIAWRASEYTASIWEEWVAQGAPRHAWGDLWWLNNLDQGRFARSADKLQDLFPGAFCSFKANCNPNPPADARVICFHGKPRPHETPATWVRDVWRVGGGGIANLEIVANTEHSRVVELVRQNCKRDLPWLEFQPAHARHAVIVGGGPSVTANLDEIRRRHAEGQIVFALNGAARHLHRHGILADAQVILDSRPGNAGFVLLEVPQHYLCSQCDPEVFDRAKNIVLYHVNTQATNEAMAGGREATLISTGSTVGLIAMGLVYTMGFRALHLYGMDSSYTEDHHAYEQKLNDDDRVVEAIVGERRFKCAPWMVAQVEQFQQVAAQLADDGCVITVAGDGLLPHVARLMSQPQEIAA